MIPLMKYAPKNSMIDRPLCMFINLKLKGKYSHIGTYKRPISLVNVVAYFSNQMCFFLIKMNPEKARLA